MLIKLYLDENVQTDLADALKRAGINAITTEEVGRKSTLDVQQLDYSTSVGRIILSYNRKHYIKLHNEYLAKGKKHGGIIVSDQISVGEAVKMLKKLCKTLTADDMINRLEYLSNWR